MGGKTPENNDEAEEADLWFLPGPPPEEDQPAAVALTGLGLAGGWAAEWAAAEGALGADLAALAFDAGRLEERVAILGPGMRDRLARIEALSLGWWAGDRIAADRLALWLSFRVGATGEDAGALTRVAWAARRLAAPPGRSVAEALALTGQNAALLAEVEAGMQALAPLHPVTRGAAAFHLWQHLDERPDHLRGLEAAVLGARLATPTGRAGTGASGALGFLPLTAAGFGALTTTGDMTRRLGGWIGGAHQAVLSALMTLERLRHWQDRALAATADLSGRTPPRLIACLMAHPMVPVPLAETETGASRAAAQRNLDTFQARGLIREVTGAGRFRVWTAST